MRNILLHGIWCHFTMHIIVSSCFHLIKTSYATSEVNDIGIVSTGTSIEDEEKRLDAMLYTKPNSEVKHAY